MIKRNIRKRDVPVEKLIDENSFNFKGIDISSPPSNFSTVEDMDNFDVGLDGALALRKPLLLKDGSCALDYFIGFLYDDSILKINFDTDKRITSFQIKDTQGRVASYINYKSMNSSELLGPYLGVVDDPKDLKIINTNTSSILTGVKINVNLTNDYREYAKGYMPTDTIFNVHCPIRIVEKELQVPSDPKQYDLTLLKLETPKPYTDPDTLTSQIYFNLLNYYPYSLQDNYESKYIATPGVMLYKPEVVQGYWSDSYLNSLTVEQLTESSKFTLIDLVYKGVGPSKYVLKAFLNVDSKSTNLYCTWEQTFDGINYTVCDKIANRDDAINVDVTDYSKSYESLEDSYKATRSVKYVKLSNYNPGNTNPYGNLSKGDLLSTRPDVLLINPKQDQNGYTYRFSIRSIIYKDEDDGQGGTVQKQYSTELAFAIFKVIYTDVNEVLTSNFTNINTFIRNANSIYYNYRTWYFGEELKNTIYFSDVDSMTVSAENTLTLSTDEYITSLTPWRNYLIATTANRVYLIYKLNDGYAFKVINTFVGVDKTNARTCKAILNSIIFKSGSKIFTLQPNPYGSDDTILNITDISKPIADLLVEGTDNFAISTEQFYYVFIPLDTTTLIFKYDYAKKIWVKLTYPVKIVDYKFNNVSDIYLIDNINKIYYFEKDLDFYKENNPEYIDADFDGYGDFLDTDKTVTPITFTIDFGQKASNLQITKKYSELKLILENLDITDNKNITSRVFVDGIFLAKEQNTLTTDVNTDDHNDTSSDDVLTLNTNIVNISGTDIYRLRQIILRFLAKGKTIKYYITGSTTSNFKIHTVSYRFRIPHVKQ